MIEVQDMSFRYGKKLLFENLRLSLQAGRISGLLGLNGAGKSTLMKLLCGLLFPTGGTIRVGEEEPARRRAELLSRLFLLSEENRVPPISAEEYLNIRAPFYPRFDRQAFKHYAAELELPSMGQKLSRLSYGQKKKFLLAFGLASGTDLL
ncbi:MAG: ATP-binding cassette domain-containing protein, partial [Spirochaetota bacterium]